MAESATPAKHETKASRSAYAAFVSYSHSDSEVCDRLHRRLESYVVPHSLVGRQGPDGAIGKRLGKFFRDRADLGAHHNLGAEIREALEASSALIVLCSPRSAGSPYVEEEIRYFKSLGRGERIFAAIISGEPHAAGKPGLTAADECFPRALVYRIGPNRAVSSEPEAVEPIAADLRDKKDGIENGALKLIAGMLDVGLDDLVQRERQAEARRRRRANLIAGVMAVLALGAGVGGGLAWVNGEKLQVSNTALDGANKQLTTTNANLDLAKKDVEAKLRQNQALTTRITSVVGEISDIAGQDDAVPERLLFLSFGARLGISASALNTILDSSFGDTQQFNPTNYGGPLCIGMDYCARTFTVEQMRNDWAGILTPEAIDRLAAVWDAKKPEPKGADWETADPNFTALKRVLGTVDDIVVDRRDAIRVFGRAQLPPFCEQVQTIWPEADLLPPDAFGALVYVVLYFGAGAAGRMADDVKAGRYADVPAGIRALGKLQSAKAPGIIGERIRKWSEEQAQMYERGLKSAAPVAVGSAANPG